MVIECMSECNFDLLLFVLLKLHTFILLICGNMVSVFYVIFIFYLPHCLVNKTGIELCKNFIFVVSVKLVIFMILYFINI